MEQDMNITRKKFLRTCGAALAGGSIAGISAILLRRMYAAKDEQTMTCSKSEAKRSDCSNCPFNCPSTKKTIPNS